MVSFLCSISCDVDFAVLSVGKSELKAVIEKCETC